MIFANFKHYFLVFNANKHLTVPFYELARGRSRVGHLRFFCLHRFNNSLILLIA